METLALIRERMYSFVIGFIVEGAFVRHLYLKAHTTPDSFGACTVHKT